MYKAEKSIVGSRPEMLQNETSMLLADHAKGYEIDRATPWLMRLLPTYVDSFSKGPNVSLRTISTAWLLPTVLIWLLCKPFYSGYRTDPSENRKSARIETMMIIQGCTDWYTSEL
jgi:hypothetical protein